MQQSALAGQVYGSLAAVCELSGVHYTDLRAWRDAGELRPCELREAGQRREWQPVYRLSDVLALRNQKEKESHGTDC